ncbi:MAG: endonuclease/exonuclease/phosphatase family protein [Betaproteobacteria bacterium]|nr:endonuclease/exonuclease/phosphatase family protein [Betaproteobacteria bacterium]
MRLLTWNIQWGRGMDGRVDLARIHAAIAAHGEFDVICLQEVAVNFAELPGSRGEDGVSELYRLFPGHLPVYGPAVDLPASGGGRKLFGNLILSRLPVGQVFRHLLPWPADAAAPSMQRVLLEAVLDTGHGPLRVLTTHLEYYSPAQRLAQVEAIRTVHVAACAHARVARPAEAEPGPFSTSPRPASAILCGDMNAGPDAPERHRLLARFEGGEPVFRDAWETVHPNLAHAPTAGIHPVDWLDRPSCYDFIYVTEDLAGRLRACEADARTAASDHQPVWIELG